MLKQIIKYTDYNNQEREEEFYFNLTPAEVTKMELSVDGGLVQKIQKISSEKNGAEIIKLFEEIIFTAYGEKSPDGKHFLKSEALSRAFSQTEAYSILFMRLATDPDAAAKFVEAIVPQQKK